MSCGQGVLWTHQTPCVRYSAYPPQGLAFRNSSPWTSSLSPSQQPSAPGILCYTKTGQGKCSATPCHECLSGFLLKRLHATPFPLFLPRGQWLCLRQLRMSFLWGSPSWASWRFGVRALGRSQECLVFQNSHVTEAITQWPLLF